MPPPSEKGCLPGTLQTTKRPRLPKYLSVQVQFLFILASLALEFLVLESLAFELQPSAIGKSHRRLEQVS